MRRSRGEHNPRKLAQPLSNSEIPLKYFNQIEQSGALNWNSVHLFQRTKFVSGEQNIR